MKQTVNKVLFFILRWSGIAYFFRLFFQRKKITILLFHDPSPIAFEKAVCYLITKYNIISLESFLDAKINGRLNLLPPYALVLTFDDGHIGNYALLEVVKKYKVDITIFLCSGIIGTNRRYWFKEKIQNYSNSYLKRITNAERLDILEKNGFTQDKEFSSSQALTREQILKMIPHVNMQSHTMFHPILTKCNTEEARYEISKSKEKLESEFAIHVDSIAYPNGDYSNRDIELAKKAGYRCGITVDFGYNDEKTDIFKLKRISVNDTKNRNELVAKSSGSWAFFKTKNGKKQSFGIDKTVTN